MSIMDELKKLTRPYDDDDDMVADDMDLDLVDMDEPVETPVYTRPVTQAQPQSQPQPAPAPADPISMGLGASPLGGMNDTSRPSMSSVSLGGMSLGGSAKYRVVLVQPEKFDCATTIASHLRQGNAVVLNCEATDKDVARRVVDFLSGCAYALDGSIRKAANNVYILVPRDVGVSDAEEQDEDE